MKFIHNHDKDSVSIFNTQKQLILKIIGSPLLFCQQRNGWFLACGKETIRIDIEQHKNNRQSLDVFYNTVHILSFMDETPENAGSLSIYDELPPLLKIPKLSDIQKNKWILADYRDVSDKMKSSHKIRRKKVKKAVLNVPVKNMQKARFREL